ELKWTNATGVLKIRGVVFLPSNAKNSQDLMYDAPAPGATLYVSGKYTSGAGTDMCGLRSASPLTAAMTPIQSTASVVSTAGFPNPAFYKGHFGTVTIDSEQMTYAGVTPDDPSTPA